MGVDVPEESAINPIDLLESLEAMGKDTCTNCDTKIVLLISTYHRKYFQYWLSYKMLAPHLCNMSAAGIVHDWERWNGAILQFVGGDF